MPLYSLRQTDKERCAILACPRDGAIVALAGGPDEIDTGYLTLTKADGDVTAFLPAAVRADIVLLHGGPDDGDESPEHTPEAERAMLLVPRPPETPMGELSDLRGSYLSDLEDTARLYNAPFAWIEARTKRPCPRGARLVQAGSLAREIASMIEAGRQEDAKAAARAKAQIANAKAQFSGPVAEGEFLIGRDLPANGSPPVPMPHTITDDDIAWTFYSAPCQVALRSKPGRYVLKAGDKFPEGFSNDLVKHAPRTAMPAELWQENRRALRLSRKGAASAPRPEPTLRYLALAEELVASRARHLNLLVGLYPHLKLQTVEDVVRGFRVPPSAAVEIIRRVCDAVKGAGDQGFDPEALCVQAWQSDDAAAVPWGSLIPQGWIDRVGERAVGLLPRLRAWLSGRDRVTTPEIVAALEDVNEADPAEHAAILRAAGELGFTTRRVRQSDGTRVQTFVRDGSVTPPEKPKSQQFLWKRSVAECVEPEVQ